MVEIVGVIRKLRSGVRVEKLFGEGHGFRAFESTALNFWRFRLKRSIKIKPIDLRTC